MFVVYHIRSTMEKKSYKYECDAKYLVEKLNKNNSDYAYTTREDYETNVVKTVTRKNLMSGKEYQEKSNTPGYMSPSSEAYWSS